jgi:NADH:ubiquinone oxidoreductase subunit H
LILLTEYANIIGMSFWMIILFSIFTLSLLLVLFFVCLIRSTLNRLKFDELMTNAWIVLLPILFYVLFISLLY